MWIVTATSQNAQKKLIIIERPIPKANVQISVLAENTQTHTHPMHTFRTSTPKYKLLI